MTHMLPVAPSGRRSLADVLPGALDALLGRPGIFAPTRVERIVVVLVDGLGSMNLRQRAGHARTLAPALTRASTLVSGFPTTTATALASLTTGVLPGAHGMVGYRVLDRVSDRLVNQLSGWDERMVPEQWQPRQTVFERATAEGVRAGVVGPSRYARSGLTRAILRGADYHPAGSVSERFATARALLDEGGRQLVYLYVPELDMAAHARGWESPEWTAALEQLDGEVGAFVRRLRPSEGLLVTADHGIVDVPAFSHVLVERGPLLDGVRHLGGEPRCLQLHLEPGVDADEVARRWVDAEGGRSWIGTRADVVASGWFGEVGPAAADRMGDVFVAARKAIAYYAADDPAGRAMIGQHGSLTPEETQVPLLGFGALAPR
ncbi:MULTISPECIES: alkaline phosphatase family protein [unclassified Rathayibacter]|uniref:alkaline phosphatase family protein n=1 Tax=unclassified Rathayibacter TaxID=2609250 RepID=UPI00188A8713|nr:MULTISPECIES: nucleotide pyrophosphatase/phosphodiesterase family protein [unclassified Rathayibacter]MBF4462302.1 alkaline phosphatase family protein [Rathayibacter sp. VKM Ac-2879]MBF4503655.1 alkaline phosphatase family protein [Rathayibacter sp. VKM Ac-2878]